MAALLAFRAATASLLKPQASTHVLPFPRSALRLGVLTLQPSSRYVSDSAKKLFKDDNIPYRVVQLVNPETERLEPPVELKALLSTIDRKKEYILLVSDEPAPLVKIINKKEAFEKRKAQKQKKKEVARKNVQKEIQMTWGVAAGDLAHKLKKVRTELEKGCRVNLVWAPKSGHPTPAVPEMLSRAQEAIDLLADVGKEWKPKDVQKSVVILYLQGTIQET